MNGIVWLRRMYRFVRVMYPDYTDVYRPTFCRRCSEGA